jgi:hypothetical protein
LGKPLQASLWFRSIAAAIVAGSFAGTTCAQEVQAPVAGGSGGSYFEYSCGPGRMLVGLRGSAGVLVDAVQAVCARVDAAGYVSEARPAGPVFGGPRPFDKVADCPDQQAIQSLKVSQTENEPLVGSIKITCLEVARFADGGRTELEIEGSGHLALYDSPQLLTSSDDRGYYWDSNCPNETYAVGIRGRASQYLDAIGLICAPKSKAAPIMADGPFANLVGQEVSFQAANYLDRFIRHRHSLGYAEPISGELGRADATFRIVPGLAGKCISLESRNYPGQFLRHHFWRIKLAPRENSDTYRNDATFCMVQGLASSTGVSLESVNAPGHFIRHRGGELWVDRFDGSDLARRDATFNVTHPGGIDVR